MQTIQLAQSTQSLQIYQEATRKNRECLYKHQQRIHELMDYLMGVKPLKFQKAIHYQRTPEDEQRLLWLLNTTRKHVIEPLQREYQQLMAASHE